MFGRILMADDGSEGAAKAVPVAIDLARQYGAELHVVAVEEVPYVPTTIGEVEDAREEADHRLMPAIERAKQLAKLKDITLVTHLVAGHPTRAIVELIETYRFDLLVIGFNAHSGFYDRIIGGTAHRLVQLAPCAVLVVK